MIPGVIGGANYPEAIAKQDVVRRRDATLRENLDDQIVILEQHLQSLKDAKERLEKSGILDSRIEDIQIAMRY